MVKLSDFPLQFRKKTVQERIKRVCRENDVIFLAVFGSFVKGTQTKKSDLDLLVKFDRSKEKSLLDLIGAEQAMRKVFNRKVDLLTVRGLSPYLRRNILKSMKVVYER